MGPIDDSWVGPFLRGSPIVDLYLCDCFGGSLCSFQSHFPNGQEQQSFSRVCLSVCNHMAMLVFPEPCWLIHLEIEHRTFFRNTASWLKENNGNLPIDSHERPFSDFLNKATPEGGR